MSAADLVPELQRRIDVMAQKIIQHEISAAEKNLRIKQLEAALDKFGVHQRSCQFAPFSRVYAFSVEKRKQLEEQGCTCGLDAARKGER